ncbi:MAG: methylmalonyl-CoA mutase [Deltaproteobacteria bacterium]|nr:methylmalonyl-CoA mutase [Deltaproteobacteria bacterium]
MKSDDERDALRQARERWEKGPVADSLRRLPERENLRTWSEIPVARLYGPTGSPPDGYLERIGFPGEFPYTRGAQATGYRAKLWTRRPITGFRSAADTNRRVRELLRQGQTGLHFVFDYPTLTGYDSDEPIAEGEIGVSGIPINSLDDVRALLDGIDLDAISISYSHWGPYLLSFLLALADERGVPYEKLSGTTQNDVLMYYHSCPWWDLPLAGNLKLFVDVCEFAVRRMPLWNPVSISGYNIRDGGCTAIQEIAFTFGDAIAYLDACRERGLTVEEVAPRFSFMLCAHIDFFEEIGKMRAMRRMWARIIRDRYGSQDPRAQRFRFHAQTSGTSLTAQQPHNNIVRGAVEAMAAVLGGAQSLHVSCYDETYGLPTEEAIRVSLGTQNILGHEAGIADTVDPLGGSYFVEALTDELEKRAAALLAEIDAQGGMVRAAKSGWVMAQKHAWAARYQAEIDRGERTIVGVNDFRVAESREIQFLRPDPEAQRRQIERVRALRARRDAAAARRAWETMRDAAAAGENVVPHAIAAAKADVTLGEMFAAMRAVYGEVPAHERLYDRMDATEEASR